MKGFFKEDQVRKQNADRPWKRSEADRLIELYLGETPPKRIAKVLERDFSAIKQRLNKITNNEHDYVVNYEPFRRYSRKGKRLTANEHALVQTWTERKIKSVHQARFLQRDVGELPIPQADREKLIDMKRVGVGVDLVLAYRYLYYVQGISMLSDQAYDALEKEEMEFGAYGSLLKQNVGSDRSEDYSPHIRALAIYLAFKYAQREKDEHSTGH